MDFNIHVDEDSSDSDSEFFFFNTSHTHLADSMQSKSHTLDLVFTHGPTIAMTGIFPVELEISSHGEHLVNNT